MKTKFRVGLFLCTGALSLSSVACGGDDDGDVTNTETGTGTGIGTTTRFLGDEKTESATYIQGTHICFAITNGSFVNDIGLIINSGSPTDTLTAVFKPYSFRPDNEEEQAKEDIAGVTMELTSTADCGIMVEVVKNGSTNSGANVVVTMPAGFTGGVTVDINNGGVDANLSGGVPAHTSVVSDNGGVTVIGAAGRLGITVNNGGSDVRVQAWGNGDQDGIVHVGNGDLDFSVGSGVTDGYISAVADGVAQSIVGPNTGTWTEQVSSNASKSYMFGSFNSKSHAEVALTTGNGTITIIK